MPLNLAWLVLEVLVSGWLCFLIKKITCSHFLQYTAVFFPSVLQGRSPDPKYSSTLAFSVSFGLRPISVSICQCLGGCLWAASPPLPVMTICPENDASVSSFDVEGVVPTCVVTRAIIKGEFQPSSEGDKDLSEVDTPSPSDFPLEVLWEQQGDQSLKEILERVFPVSVIDSVVSGYFFAPC